jgi:hypothetical protein
VTDLSCLAEQLVKIFHHHIPRDSTSVFVTADEKSRINFPLGSDITQSSGSDSLSLPKT